jgi:hypothetical protein
MAVSKAVIPPGAALSQTITLGARRIEGFVMPAAWTAAPLTFVGSVDNVNYLPLYSEDGTELVVQAAAGRFVTLKNDVYTKFDTVDFIQVRSGTSGTPVNQTAGATVSCVTRDPS